MIDLIIIQVILVSIIALNFKLNCYEDKKCTKRATAPMWFVILVGSLTFIPIIGLLSVAIFGSLLFNELIQDNMYMSFKRFDRFGKISKFLNKRI